MSVTKSQDPDMSEVSCDLSRGIDFEPFGMYIEDGLPQIGKIIKEAPQKKFKTKEDEYVPF